MQKKDILLFCLFLVENEFDFDAQIHFLTGNYTHIIDIAKTPYMVKIYPNSIKLIEISRLKNVVEYQNFEDIKELLISHKNNL